MKIAIAGGSGFLGRALAERLLAGGHTVSILGRGGRDSRAPGGASDPAPVHVAWSPDGTVGPWASAIDGADAVVNLAGASIGAKRWSAAVKAAIRDSRVAATRSLVAAIRSVRQPPAALISASAQGYYGSRGAEELTEDAAPGADFLSGVCVTWEQEAREALPFVKRLVLVRSALVLDLHEGALGQILAPFRLYAGGPIGSGRQYVSWIHRDDWVSLVQWALVNEAVNGPVNASAPNPVTNAEFAKALGRAVHRPSVVTTPALAVRLAVGEMADALVLSSQRVIPARATALGFRFRFPDLDAALRDLFQNA